MSDLSLAEQLLLVAFDDTRGKPTANPQLALPFALAGAVVLEQPDIDPTDVKRQVKKLAGRRENLQGRLLDQLVGRGILADREGRVLGIKVKRHTLVDAATRDGVLASLRATLTGEGDATSLAALAGTCGLVDRVVDKDQRKAARHRARDIAQGNVAGRAVSSAVQEVEAAVMAGVIAAVAASSVTSSGGHGH